MNRLTLAAGVIIAVWAATTLVAIVDRTYHQPEGVNSVMLIVAGALFAGGTRTPKDDE